ncbi:Uncharacterized protein TCM_005041 [Theobroma cacao]|uniref:Uncharacterized protein n=1 Tax=Theobroma cacao TaxID=3641 RepID=A0A061DT74_THECC|nr:Uncharacterized protein TCM_005041 [Theobroma cacao]
MGDVVRRKDHAPQDKNKLVACPSKSQDQVSSSAVQPHANRVSSSAEQVQALNQAILPVDLPLSGKLKSRKVGLLSEVVERLSGKKKQKERRGKLTVRRINKNKLSQLWMKAKEVWKLSKSVGLSANGDEEEIFAQLLAWAQVNGRQQDYQPRFNSKPINCCPGHPFACH